MKKIISACIFLAFAFVLPVIAGGCIGSQPKETFTIEHKQKLTVGSTGANLPLLQKLADAYMAKNKNVIIEIPVSMNNEGAVRNVQEGNIDVALTSFPLEKNNKKYLQQKLLARTIVVIGVNPSVTISGLTKQQLLDIYSGKIKNWREVGGVNSKIILLSSERGRSTMTVIDKFVKGFRNLKVPKDTILLKDYQTVNEGIISIRESIGWSDIGTIKAENLKIKPLVIDGVEPTVENYRTGKYPMAKDLYLLFQRAPTGVAQDFVNYVLGWEGKKMILDNGYLVPEAR